MFVTYLVTLTLLIVTDSVQGGGGAFIKVCRHSNVGQKRRRNEYNLKNQHDTCLEMEERAMM